MRGEFKKKGLLYDWQCADLVGQKTCSNAIYSFSLLQCYFHHDVIHSVNYYACSYFFFLIEHLNIF